VVPSHNRWDLLERCLATVREHAPPHAEILVVDDASPAAAVSAVARRFPAVRVLRLARQAGFCSAVNAGVAAARGDVIEVLNDDTEVAAGWADAALRWFAQSEVAAVAPLVLLGPDGRRVDSAGDRYYLGGVAGKRGHGALLTRAFEQPRRTFGASASSAFYRREAFLKVGGFPTSFGAYFEDVDLAFRLNRAGFTTIFEPASKVLHRLSASHGLPGRRLLAQLSRNEERVFWRNVPARSLPAALPRHLLVLAGKAWRRWREGRLTPFLCGRLRLIAELPAILRHRRQLRRLGPATNIRPWQLERRFWGSHESPA